MYLVIGIFEERRVDSGIGEFVEPSFTSSIESDSKDIQTICGVFKQQKGRVPDELLVIVGTNDGGQYGSTSKEVPQIEERWERYVDYQ